MTTTIEAYIGSNNHTHKLELEKIKRIISRNHSGFTLKGVVTGYWNGAEEKTAVVLLSDERDKVERTLQDLKRELHQEAIATQQVPHMEFI